MEFWLKTYFSISFLAGENYAAAYRSFPNIPNTLHIIIFHKKLNTDIDFFAKKTLVVTRTSPEFDERIHNMNFILGRYIVYKSFGILLFEVIPIVKFFTFATG